jgi:uracil-DNA glycosylase
MRAPDPGRGAGDAVRVTADDLPAAFASLPATWRVVLPGGRRRPPRPWSNGCVRCRRTRDRAGRSVPRAAPGAARRSQGGGLRPGPLPAARPCRRAGLFRRARQAALAATGVRRAGGRPAGLAAARAVGARRLGAQGVLLLNPVLTVEVGLAGSHMNCGWQALTSEIVQVLCRARPPAFLLWGKPANAFFDAACPPGAPRSAHAPPVARHAARVHGRRQPLRRRPTAWTGGRWG